MESKQIKEVEWKLQYDLIFVPYYKLKGSFVHVIVRANKFEEWYNFIVKESSYIFILNVRLSKDEILAKEEFNMLVYTDHDFTARNSKLFTYRFILLWHRVVKEVQGMVLSVITAQILTMIKQTIGDTARTPKMRFICRIEQTVFIEYKGRILVYDIDTSIVREYGDTKQVDMFEISLISKFKIEFFEKFIKKNLHK